MSQTHNRPIGVLVAEALPDAQAFGGQEIHASSCSVEACQTQPGDLYFAITTPQGDGHDVAHQAVARGAKAVVAERLLPLEKTPQFVVPDSRKALGEFCQRLVGGPSDVLRISGVAGAHGKSSVSKLLAASLQHAGLPTSVLAPFPSASVAAPCLAKWLSRCAAQGDEHAVIETPNRALAQRAFAGVEFDLACFTTFNFDPLRERSLETLRTQSATLLDGLIPSGVMVANVDDPGCCRLVADSDHAVVTYAMQKPAEITGRVVERTSGEQTLVVTEGSTSVAIQTSIIGDAHAQNCLAALAASRAYGVDLATAAHGMESVIRLRGVMESTPYGQPFPLYFDSATTPKRLASALATARGVCEGRVLTVYTPEGQTRSHDQRFPVAHSMSDLLITSGERTQATSNASDIRWVDDRFEAIALAVGLADLGDVVVIAGGSRQHDPQADRDVARQLISLRLANAEETCATY